MKREKIIITTPFIKLDSFLKLCGAADTGGTAKIMVMEGLVKVDGELCAMRGKKLYPGALVSVYGDDYEVSSP